MTEPTPKQIVAGQAEGLADSAVSGIQALSPADRSWVAGFVIVVLIIVGADAFVAIRASADSVKAAERLTGFIASVEANRAQELNEYQAQQREETRRYQEMVRHLVDAVARDSERAGQVAVQALDRQGQALSQNPNPGEGK